VYRLAPSSAPTSPEATRAVAAWIAWMTFWYSGDGAVKRALLSASVESIRYLLDLNSATSAASVRATGWGSSAFSLPTISAELTALMNSQAACLFLLPAVMYQQVPGPPMVNDGPPVSVGWST
jgi:hypothetical protein